MRRNPEPKPNRNPQDKLFADPRPRMEDFNFGKKTTEVFDDMLNRSVPFYGEIQRMVAELSVDFAESGSSLYDIGCSTCNTFLAIDALLPKDVNLRFVGVDSSPEMIEKAKAKLAEAQFSRDCELRCQNFEKEGRIENASVVLMILTLQFMRPLNRDRVIAEIYRGLRPHGCLILVEKVLGEHSTFNRLFIKHYYEMKKRQGYSDLEISQKREALENVLIPYRLEENKELLKKEGFEKIDVFFKWYNFCGMLAMK
jgi:tRNA (cmo5U34)-methyltransferase